MTGHSAVPSKSDAATARLRVAGNREAPLLVLENVVKEFHGVQALKAVSLSSHPGEVHALVGENGAGKSTLMKIIAGAQHPDSGEVRLAGQSLTGIDEHTAGQRGIGMVHQERSLVPQLSVAENMFAGRQPVRMGNSVDWKEMRRRADALLAQLRAPIRADTLVGYLSPAQQQMVEIAKALSLDLKVLILDEPTASLTVNETEHLFDVVRELSAQGVSTIYISHRLAEVFQIADTVTVLKDGAVAGRSSVDQIDEAGLMRLMVGRDVDLDRRATSPAGTGTPALELRHLSSPPRVRDASLTVHAGEIVCLAGLVGAGRTELCEAVFGVRGTAGEILINGEPYRIGSPADAMRSGVGMIPEDRKSAGLFLDMSIAENLTATNLGAVSRLGLVSRKESRKLAQDFVERLRIATPNIDLAVGQLSGGNQQKVLLAKWLARSPKILLVDEPTRGVDVGARADIYAVLRSLADAGTAVLVVSSDLPEVLTLADRIVVMSEGQTTGELQGADATELAILELASIHVHSDGSQS